MSQPKNYGLNELREMFLHFFETKDHLRLPSFSLIPQNDASLLLINSGMAPMKPYFTGEQEPPRHRVTTCQKCIRTGDIENIGHTARHGTYFEMLGNFSFGDYFKDEAIHWTWEFLTEVVGLDPDRLYPSVYLEDDDDTETYQVVTTMRQDALHGLISRESPVGRALLGKKVGERFYIRVNDTYGYYAVIRAIEKAADDGSIPLNGY